MTPQEAFDREAVGESPMRCCLCDQYRQREELLLFRWKDKRIMEATPEWWGVCGVRYVCCDCAKVIGSALFGSYDYGQRVESTDDR